MGFDLLEAVMHIFKGPDFDLPRLLNCFVSYSMVKLA